MAVRFSKEQVLASVKISDIAESFGISLSDISSGNFTHRCKCPGKDHKSGLERTGSLYVDDINNNFYCFGCGASNNAIDFYILCTGKTFSEAIKDLSKKVNPSIKRAGLSRKKQSIFPVLLSISTYLREVQLAHPNDRVWTAKLIERTDKHISSIGRYDTKSAERLFVNIKRTVFKRYIKT